MGVIMFSTSPDVLMYVTLSTILVSPFVVYWASQPRIRAGWVIAIVVSALSFILYAYYESEVRIGGVNDIRLDLVVILPPLFVNLYLLVKVRIKGPDDERVKPPAGGGFGGALRLRSQFE